MALLCPRGAEEGTTRKVAVDSRAGRNDLCDSRSALNKDRQLVDDELALVQIRDDRSFVVEGSREQVVPDAQRECATDVPGCVKLENAVFITTEFFDSKEVSGS